MSRGGSPDCGESAVFIVMNARRTFIHRGFFGGLALAALLCGCDVMGGGPSVVPPSNGAVVASPTPAPSPSASPTVSPAGSARKANGAGIR